MYPNADVFAIAADEKTLSPTIHERNLYTSPLNRLINGSYRYKRSCFMPLFPFVVERMDLSDYDLVITSCGPAIMGVNTRPDAVQISYVHSPQRAWWDLHAAKFRQMSWLTRAIFLPSATFMRMYEFSAMQRVEHVVSNSQYIAKRVAKYFRRDSTVIYPPVDTSRGYIADSHDDYYLTVSRLDVDKRIDLLIEACNRLGRRLVIAGTGREETYLKSLAGRTIEFVGRVSDKELSDLYARCRAFLFAADEDFGIVPVEAQSFGRPVLAYGHGGSLETVRIGTTDGKGDTGLYFPEQTIDSVLNCISQFELVEDRFNPRQIQNHSRKFDTSVFSRAFKALADRAVERDDEREYRELAS
jgi:glycosyltransferase involved in cell wall biosynthesis